MITIFGWVVTHAGAVQAQSLLGQMPESLEKAWSTGDEKLEMDSTDLDSSLELVEKGKGGGVYYTLKSRLDDLSARSVESYPERNKILPRLMFGILKAGDSLADPVDQYVLSKKLLDEFPNYPENPQAFFFMAQAMYQLGIEFQPSEDFSSRSLASLPSDMQTRYLLMMAAIAKNQGLYRQAALYLAMEQNGNTLHKTTQDDVLIAAGRITSQKELDGLLSSVSWLKAKKEILQARVYQNEGMIEEAREAWQKIEDKGLVDTSLDQRFLNEAREEIESMANTRPRRIGVLLPLNSSSSTLPGISWSVLDGIRMAVQFNSSLMKKGGPPLELVIKDTSNNPAQAARLVEELVRLDQVSAIIGPLAREESIAAFKKAEELKVPIISVSLSAELPDKGEYSFRNNMSWEAEVRDLVAYAMDYRDAKRFSIVYPNTPFGKSMTRVFWDEVRRKGGEIAGAGAYDPWTKRTHRSKVGLQEVFEHLTGMDRFFSDADLEWMDKANDRAADPIVDFDALFIPIGPMGGQDVKQIASYPVTVNAENKLLLGSRDWNSDEVLVAGEDKLNGAVFVDSFSRESGNKGYENFRRLHRNYFGHRSDYRVPDYFTAIGYDTANMLASLTEDPHIQTRRRIGRALKTMEPFSGITGDTHFKGTGEAAKDSRIFQIWNEQISQVVIEKSGDD
ncbi:MAG: penicillin-binding protein activator [Deltaproteobacteria bacterium]|nr:penicillin-binding protein activator [Deltaproteobacteria bacterium]